MGKGNKPNVCMPARVKSKKTGDDEKKGCNSPQNCLLGENPPIDCSRNPAYVKVICSNEKCGRNQYLHKECYDFWEEKIIIGVQKSQVRTRDWTDQQVRRYMWSRAWDVAYRHCKCVCGGHLKRADVLELVEAPEPQAAAAEGQKKPKKNKQPQQGGAVAKSNPLPKLTQSSRNVYTNRAVRPWVAAGGSTFNAGASAAASKRNGNARHNSMESLTTADSGGQDNYIPGLFIAKEPKTDSKNQRRVSASSGDDKQLYDVFRSPSFSPPVTSPCRQLLSPTFSLSSEASKGDDWIAAAPPKAKGDANTGCNPFDMRFGKIGDYDKSAEAAPDWQFVVDNEYRNRLAAHAQLGDPETPYTYSRHLYEVKALLDEMNAMMKP